MLEDVMKLAVAPVAVALVAYALSSTSAAAHANAVSAARRLQRHYRRGRRFRRQCRGRQTDQQVLRPGEYRPAQGAPGRADLPGHRRPSVYSGGDMRSVHAGMGIESRHFNALVEDLGKSLNKFKVPPREQKELVAILAPMKRDIVTR
jgi:hypothetical protein